MESYTYLAHWGIKGQRHGERRYQNYDGSLTPLGRIRYGVGEARQKAKTAAKIAGVGIAIAKANKGAIAQVGLGALRTASRGSTLSRAASLARTGIRAANSYKRRSEKRAMEMSLANITRQRDYYAKKAKATAFIENLKRNAENAKEKTTSAMNRAASLSDSRFRARMNAGRSYVYNMRVWEDIMTDTSGRNRSIAEALPTRMMAAREFASGRWRS